MTTTTRATNRKADSASSLVRLSVNMNADTAAALKEMAEENGISYTEAVRRAVALASFLDNERNRGRKIYTSDSERKNERELVIM